MDSLGIMQHTSAVHRDAMQGRSVISTGHIPARPKTVPPQFFTEQKRGEVNDLKQLLRLVQRERDDIGKQRDVLKKVLAFMTLGIDVSRLFSEMIMACSTNDVVQKKMIYLYLSTYAETNPDLAILVVNTLQKDSLDDDPAVRGLALRSLCSLKTINIVEYLGPAVRRGLSDCSGYVRRTAVIGVLRLYHINPSLVRGGSGDAVLSMSTEEEVDTLYAPPENCADESFLRILFALLSDVDPQVVCNAINVLNEILAAEGGLPITRTLAAKLLNRIKQFNDGAQCIILELISNYKPQDEDEIYDIFNILEDRLKHSSPAIVLAATRCFVQLTQDRPNLKVQVLMRLKTPFITLITGAAIEISYVVLLHFHHLLLILRGSTEADSSIVNKNLTQPSSVAAHIMGNEYKTFFCAYTDPAYIKSVKIDILTLIVCKENAGPILDELAEYVVIDADPAIVRKAVESLGQIGCQFEEFMPLITTQLLDFINLEVDMITTPSLIVIRDFLRHDPELFSEVQPTVERYFSSLVDPESLAATVWIFGVFGQHCKMAPYHLEKLVQTLAQQPLSSQFEPLNNATRFPRKEGEFDCVLHELMAAATRLFLQRPPEMQRTLGLLFKLIIEDDAISFDVRDRALQLYRFLYEARHNHKLLKLLENTLPSPLSCDRNTLPAILKQNMSLAFDGREPLQGDWTLEDLKCLDFNSLSLVYRLPPSKFLTVKNPIPFRGRFISSCHKRSNASNHIDTESNHQTAYFQATSTVGDAQTVDLEEADLLNFSPSRNTNRPGGDPVVIAFDPHCSIEPTVFESLWASDDWETYVFKDSLSDTAAAEIGASAQEALTFIQRAFSSANLHCVAAGIPSPDTAKSFFYGHSVTSSYPLTCLIEYQCCIGHLRTVSLTIKINRQNSNLTPTDRQIARCLLDFFYAVDKKFSVILPSTVGSSTAS